MSDESDLLILLKARCPIIYVVSHDEERVERKLIRLADQLQISITFWSATQGFCDRHGVGSASNVESREPLNALRQMSDHKGEAAIFVMRDFHGALGDPLVRRQLRDLARGFRGATRTCLFLSPILDLPAELEKEVEVVHFEKPSVEEHRRFVNRFLSAMKLPIDEALVNQSAELLMGLSELECESLVARSLVRSKGLDLEFLGAERGMGSDAPTSTLQPQAASAYAERLTRLLESEGDAREAILAALTDEALRQRIVETIAERWPAVSERVGGED